MISLGLDGCGGIAHMTGVLQQMDTRSSGQIGWEGEDTALYVKELLTCTDFVLEQVI